MESKLLLINNTSLYSYYLSAMILKIISLKVLLLEESPHSVYKCQFTIFIVMISLQYTLSSLKYIANK